VGASCNHIRANFIPQAPAAKEEIPTAPTPAPETPLQKAAALLDSLGIGQEPSPEETARLESEAERFTRARGLEPRIPSIADIGLKPFGYGEVVKEEPRVVEPKAAPLVGYGEEIYTGPEAEAPPVNLTDETWSVVARGASTPLPKGLVEKMMGEQFAKDLEARLAGQGYPTLIYP
jgi:hypothetical protein